MSASTGPTAGPLPPTASFGAVTVYFGEKNGKYPDANQVIVQGRDVRVALDAPLVANRIGEPFDGCDMVVLGHVHEDHMAGLHRLPDAPVHVHEADVPAAVTWQGYAEALGLRQHLWPAMRAKIETEFHYAPRPDVTPYADGAEWQLGGVTLRAVHMPGHTAGHCALIIEEEGVAFIGDIDLSGFGPYYGDAGSSLESFRKSLRLLPALPARVWITAHHRGVYTDRDKLIAHLAAYEHTLVQREERLLDMLKGTPKSLAELAKLRLIYPADYEEIWVEDVERRTIVQHLDELVVEGRVRREGDLYLRLR